MITACVFETRIGWVGLAARNAGICRLILPKSSRAEALTGVCAGLDARVVEDDAELGGLPEMLASYFDGEKVSFSEVRVDLMGITPFRLRALRECGKIGYGTVFTYGELAARIGSPNACRAVGGAMAANPVPIIVPCHRVLAVGGRLGGYSAGLDWKRKLLALEGVVV